MRSRPRPNGALTSEDPHAIPTLAAALYCPRPDLVDEDPAAGIDATLMIAPLLHPFGVGSWLESPV